MRSSPMRSRSLPRDWRDRLREMRSLRNVLAHEYFRVDERILWSTATGSLPLAAAEIRSWLATRRL